MSFFIASSEYCETNSKARSVKFKHKSRPSDSYSQRSHSTWIGIEKFHLYNQWTTIKLLE